MDPLSEHAGTHRWKKRMALWAGAAGAVLLLIFLARFRPSWPWFSLWLLALLGGLGVLSFPAVRRSLNLSWFGVTLFTLTGVACFTLYLFHVETHRQRSERLEIHGVYFDPDHQPLRVGVGYPDLDVRLEGSLRAFDRWALEMVRREDGTYQVQSVDQVDMVRVPGKVWWNPWGRTYRPVLGASLGADGWFGADSVPPGEPGLRLLREGPRGTLSWEGSRAPLAEESGLLDRRLSRRLDQGIPLSDLRWDSLPDRERAEELVLTRVQRGKAFGRIRISMPEYRLVHRSGAMSLGPDSLPPVEEGDTIWVTSRGKRWAFSVDRVPGVSRVAAPIAIRFVRRPRTNGWALPSPEACGSDAHRCAVLSTRPLPPPQAHFDLSGFGLDTVRYSILARLETDREEVRLVGADFRSSFPYGEIHPLPALPASGSLPETGLLVRVHRTSQGQQSAVALTVMALFFLILGALATVSGDPELWKRRKHTTPNVSAAWILLNLFLIFMGLRLALGLRVAYSPPFYDRAASTAVGLWITFAVMAVGLGRWSSWTPGFWRLLRKLERPASRLFLPGVNGSQEEGVESPDGLPRGADPPAALATVTPRVDPVEEARERRRGRFRTFFGVIVMASALGLVLWQRPDAAPSLLVAATGIGVWLAMALSRRRSQRAGAGSSPLSVITAETAGEKPSVALALAASGSVVLALAIHAPWMALIPVLLFLGLVAADGLLGRWSATAAEGRRAWILLALLLVLGEVGAVALLPWPRAGAGVLLGLAALAAAVLNHRPEGRAQSHLQGGYRGFLELRSAVFQGLGWVGVLAIVGVLVFLSAQAIPPFVRFALVFLLFLLAIRAGLACNRVLEEGSRRGQVEALGLLVIPLGVLLVFMLFDFGLGLVFFVPMFLTVLLSARIDRLPGILMGGSIGVVAVIALVAWSVLQPSVDGLRSARDLPTFSAEFEGVGNGIADLLRTAGMSGPVTRASIRSLAASDPDLLEEALAFAGPSEALFAAAPSRNQVWGGRAYAASELAGTGFAGTAILGRGVPTAVSYAENTFAVYVLSEHGALGGLTVLLCYLALLVAVGVWVVRVGGEVQERRLGLAVLAMTVGGVLWLVLPAVYVAASNLALVPLTGQNMPFLGLNSWADVVLVSGLSTGIVFGLVSLDDTGATAGRVP